MRPEIARLLDKSYRFSEEASVDVTVGEVSYHLEASGSEGVYFSKKTGEELYEAFVNVRPKKATAFVRPSVYPHPIMVVVDKEVITYPQTRTHIFTLVPVTVQVVLSADGMERVLDEQKEEKVLKTHYGPVDGGVTCLLSYEPVFWREEDIGPDEEYTAIVPLTMINALEDLHTMQRIVLFPEYLDLYLCEERLFTNPIAVNILSSREAIVDYQDKAPRPHATKVSTRKVTPKAGRTVKQYFGQKSKAAQEYGL